MQTSGFSDATAAQNPVMYIHFTGLSARGNYDVMVTAGLYMVPKTIPIVAEEEGVKYRGQDPSCASARSRGGVPMVGCFKLPRLRLFPAMVVVVDNFTSMPVPDVPVIFSIGNNKFDYKSDSLGRITKYGLKDMEYSAVASPPRSKRRIFKKSDMAGVQIGAGSLTTLRMERTAEGRLFGLGINGVLPEAFIVEGEIEFTNGWLFTKYGTNFIQDAKIKVSSSDKQLGLGRLQLHETENNVIKWTIRVNLRK